MFKSIILNCSVRLQSVAVAIHLKFPSVDHELDSKPNSPRVIDREYINEPDHRIVKKISEDTKNGRRLRRRGRRCLRRWSVWSQGGGVWGSGKLAELGLILYKLGRGFIGHTFDFALECGQCLQIGPEFRDEVFSKCPIKSLFLSLIFQSFFLLGSIFNIFLLLSFS